MNWNIQDSSELQLLVMDYCGRRAATTVTRGQLLWLNNGYTNSLGGISKRMVTGGWHKQDRC